MKVVTINYKVYNFKELSTKAKDKAIINWYEVEDYPFLEDNLLESLKEFLNEYKIDNPDDSLKHQYSLSWSQGDGYSFSGKFKRKVIVIAMVSYTPEK